MSKDNITAKDKSTMLQENLWTKAFTFIEVIVALTIVSISLLALFRLHLISVRMTEAAEITSQAVFLAEEKIAEKLALGYPEEETDTGTVEKNGLPLQWQTEVTDLQSPQLDEANITGLRKVLVDVSWKQGSGCKHLQMSTYVADWKLNEK
jgi:type II secretion system protein I